MLEWLESAAGPAYAQAVMWTALALLALVVVLVAIKVFRSLTFGTFVSGGRTRKARLAVMDATAVDSQRRLVLVRRDDVEHLLIIGGASDVVVERDIRVVEASQPQFSTEEEPAGEEEMRGSVEAPKPIAVPLAAVHKPEPPEPLRTNFAASRPPPATEERLRPVPQTEMPSPVIESETPQQEHLRPTEVAAPRISHGAPAAVAATAAPAVAVASSPPPTAASDGDLDDALLQELELTLETDRPDIEGEQRHDPVLDEEMDRLLGELADDRR